MKFFSFKCNLALLLVLCLLELAGTSFIIVWREWFWDAVGNRNFDLFIVYITQFSVVALALCVIVGFGGYLVAKIALEWRRRLTRVALKLSSKSHSEGFAQRVQEDCRDYPLLMLRLLKEFIMSALMMVIITVIIYKQVGLYYTIIPYIYVICSTAFGWKIAFPLIKLNYLNQVKEAAFRQFLKKTDYAKVHRNNHELYRKTKHLNYVQVFFGQLSAIFPYVLLASLYFSSKITLGVLMQIASAIIHLTDSLGSIIQNFDTINKWLSCRKRLKELTVI